MDANLKLQNKIELTEKKETNPIIVETTTNFNQEEDNTLEILDPNSKKGISSLNNKKEPTVINNPLTNKKTYSNISKEDNEFLNKQPMRITSDNFMEGYPPFLKKENYKADVSRVHLILKLLDHHKIEHPKKEEIIYQNISANFLGQMMGISHEISPINYSMDYFKKHIVKTTQFAIGAFIKIENEYFLIGYCLAEFSTEKKFRQHVPHVLRKKSCCTKIKDFFTKNEKDKFGYISTVTVINEYRRQGVGTELVYKMVEYLKSKEVIGIFTHILEHNCSGIKFFEKLGWNYGGVIFSYFTYDNNYYDGQVYYIILEKEDEFVKAEIRGYAQPPKENVISKAYRLLMEEISH